MGKEVKMTDCHGAGGDDDRVAEWEAGLPCADDLTPLSQALIPPELASAFSISPGPYRTVVDVNRASQTTLSTLRGQHSAKGFPTGPTGDNFNEGRGSDPMAVEEADEIADRDGSGSGSGSGSGLRKSRRIDCAELEADSVLRTENASDDPSSAGRTSKRARLVWTPQLHKRFVDVVAHLGIKSAVPKTIMQLMNVEGLTRENVASHLQKYRLYLKRMQGLSSEGLSSSSDHQLFASTPVPPQSLNEAAVGSSHVHGNGHVPMPIPMSYPPPQMMPMPVLGVGHMGMPVGNHGFEWHNPYNMLQQRDWSGNNNHNYGSMVSYPHVAPNDK
ncbi:transcription factor PCL1-like [Juglans microcarpa x Juglans regia]|uniref:transcription factor PCL1-like n=1 Tax=Juglans microcarpa x Juglans regia TaxID=2249226 RepID=UPI001B7F5002|nr:transcription factor PCL1-like [Juglans microcarpa x Juglans regia]